MAPSWSERPTPPQRRCLRWPQRPDTSPEDEEELDYDEEEDSDSEQVVGLPDIKTIYLKLKAKNILPRERETLNSQFALLLAKRFRASPMFEDLEEAEGGTVVMGSVPPGNSKARWFRFTLQLTLAHPIKMQDMEGAE